VIRRDLPEGYAEAVVQGMLVYQVPLARHPDTYNGQPLWYVALASHKTCLSLYLMNVYGAPSLGRRLEEGFQAEGKKLAMGKSCIRFKRASDLALNVIGELVGTLSVDRWVAIAHAARHRQSGHPGWRGGRNCHPAKASLP